MGRETEIKLQWHTSRVVLTPAALHHVLPPEKGALFIRLSNKKDKLKTLLIYFLSLPKFWSRSCFLLCPIIVEEQSCCQMHGVGIQAKASESWSCWYCGCNFRNRTVQEPWFTRLCASGRVTQQILTVVGDQLVSEAKWLQARVSLWKSQDFPSWISDSLPPSVWLEDLTTRT